jgi:hypothetical protein
LNNKINHENEIYVLRSLCDMGMELGHAMIVYAYANRVPDSLSEAYIAVNKKAKDAQANHAEEC